MSRICIVRQFYYPTDPRVRREAEALVAAGHQVDVICLRKSGEAAREAVSGVKVYRLPIEHRRGSFPRYICEYGAFFVMAFLTLLRLFGRKRYRIVQVNTMPDFLVFAAVTCKFLGARVVLDMHECMPELYQTKYGLGAGHPMIRMLARIEQWSMAFADQVITCTQQQKDVFVERGTPADKVVVVLNSADAAIFRPQNGAPAPWRDGGKFTLVSHGIVVERYGLDTIVRAVALLKAEIPGIKLQVLGSGEYLPALRSLVRQLGVDQQVELPGFVPQEEMLAAIGQAHVGVVAAKRDAFRDLTHTNKMYEYVAMRKPVVISETRAVKAYFDAGCFQYFASDDPQDLARAILDLYRHPELADQMIEQAGRRYRDYAWEVQRYAYCGAVLGDANAQPSPVLGTEQAA